MIASLAITILPLVSMRGASTRYHVNFRHAVNRLRSGVRHTVGIIFQELAAAFAFTALFSDRIHSLSPTD
jgi:hypothetical protein